MNDIERQAFEGVERKESLERRIGLVAEMKRVSEIVEQGKNPNMIDDRIKKHPDFEKIYRYWERRRGMNRIHEECEAQDCIKLPPFWGYPVTLVRESKEFYIRHELDDCEAYFTKEKGVVLKSVEHLPHERNHALRGLIGDLYDLLSDSDMVSFRKLENKIRPSDRDWCEQQYYLDSNLVRNSGEWKRMVAAVMESAKSEMIATLGVGNFVEFRDKYFGKKSSGEYVMYYLEGEGVEWDVRDQKMRAFKDSCAEELARLTDGIFEYFGGVKKDVVWKEKKDLLWWFLAVTPISKWSDTLAELGWMEEMENYETYVIEAQKVIDSISTAIFNPKKKRVAEQYLREIRERIVDEPEKNHGEMIRERLEGLRSF